MTVKRNTTSSIEHGIWKTHDGVSFEKLAVFTTDQYFESFTYAKGHFYLGYGCAPVGYGSFASSVATPATDKAGQIWRFSLPQADDDGSNDGLTPYVPTYDASAWYMGELGVTNLLNAGITGKGVKVGMVDTGIRPIVSGSVTNMAIDVWGGDASQTASHGLGVASIIKSDKFGIAPDCTLYAYNGRDFEDDINGIWWCFTNGCRVVNFSGGYTPFDYTTEQLAWATEQIRTMLAQGLILVAAGGNAPNETLTCPQDVEGVINVGGITRSRQSAGLNDNWSKDFCAFGKDVPVFVSRAGATGRESGSSFAAPMATGLIALLLQQEPSLTRDEIYGILQDTSVKLAEGRSKIYGFGLLRAARVPADYKRQAAFDAERAAFVRTTSAELLNEGLGWNAERGFYEAKMRPGESIRLEYRAFPGNATDTNLYW
jgi:subtilisin family serine protease